MKDIKKAYEQQTKLTNKCNELGKQIQKLVNLQDNPSNGYLSDILREQHKELLQSSYEAREDLRNFNSLLSNKEKRELSKYRKELKRLK